MRLLHLSRNRQKRQHGIVGTIRSFLSFRHRGPGHAPDFILFGCVMILVFFGIIMLSSATSILSFQETAGSYYFAWQQLTHGIVPGIILFFIVYRLPYRWYQRLTPLFLVAIYVLLALVFVPQLHTEGLPTQSWIDLGGFTVQTSEIAKLLFILWLAGWCTSHDRRMREGMHTSFPFFIILGSIAGLLMLQPDTGTMLLFLALGLGIFYVAEGNALHILFAVGLGGLVAIPLLLKAEYRLERIISYLNPQSDLQGAGYQVYQGLIALGSGSWFGLGIGQSQQKLYFVPEVESDSIFAIIGEELGFVFSTLLIALFVLLIIRCIRIARTAPDRYGALIAWGITLMIAVQCIVNIGAIVGLSPLTGIPLPFISLGGTNIVVLLICIGILMNISTRTSEYHG